MSRRKACMGVSVTAAFFVALLSIAAPAFAWSNGVNGPNAYGTHDWILDHALSALGHEADWVCERTALRATDDPDTVDGLDHASGTWWHVYDIWGSTYGDAPEAVQVWFNKAKKLHDAGKDCPASRALGIMAHLDQEGKAEAEGMPPSWDILRDELDRLLDPVRREEVVERDDDERARLRQLLSERWN